MHQMLLLSIALHVEIEASHLNIQKRLGWLHALNVLPTYSLIARSYKGVAANQDLGYFTVGPLETVQWVH